MAITPAQIEESAARWGLAATAAPVLDRLAAYGNLLLRWNTRFALTSIRDKEELIERHFMEGVFAAANHPPAETVLDFGSGTGIPGLVISLCCPDLRVTLAESQRKKAAFLAEAVRQLGLNATVYSGRAEILPAASFDAVWMRAVEKSETMLPIATGSVGTRVFHVEHSATDVVQTGFLCLFSTLNSLESDSLHGWTWKDHRLPFSESRILRIGRRSQTPEISRMLHVKH